MKPRAATAAPAWGRLYATSGMGVVIVGIARVALAGPAWGRALEGAFVILVYGAMFAWVYSNRLALGGGSHDPVGRGRFVLRAVVFHLPGESVRDGGSPRGETTGDRLPQHTGEVLPGAPISDPRASPWGS